MHLALQWYDIQVSYRKGKQMNVPDTLSRAFLETPKDKPKISSEETDVSRLHCVTISEQRYAELQHYTQQELEELVLTIKSGWPDHRSEVSPTLQPYWNVRSELAVLDGVVYRGMRITVPPSLCHNVLQLIHESHMRIVRSQEFEIFCSAWNINHVTCSPHSPHSNIEAERAVQTVKKLWKKTEDKQLALYWTAGPNTTGNSRALTGTARQGKTSQKQIAHLHSSSSTTSLRCQQSQAPP